MKGKKQFVRWVGPPFRQLRAVTEADSGVVLCAMSGDQAAPIVLTVSSDEPAPTAQKVLFSDPVPGLESALAQGVRPTIHRQANAEMVSVRQFAPKPGSL